MECEAYWSGAKSKEVGVGVTHEIIILSILKENVMVACFMGKNLSCIIHYSATKSFNAWENLTIARTQKSN